MLKKIIFAGIIATSFNAQAFTGDQIRAAGSSTIYPFLTVVAEEFGRNTKQKTPIVESIGTGGGFKLFCAGNGNETTDIANASRPIKPAEKEFCHRNGVDEMTEIKIGYDGIIIANSTSSKQFHLTRDQLFRALAKKLPTERQLVLNPNKKWSDIDPSFPDTKIEVYGPPPTSGTRDVFVELIMEQPCVDLPQFKNAYPDEQKRRDACHQLREDGAFIESGENDNLIVQKLKSNPDAIGIFGFSFLNQNLSFLHGSIVENTEPTFENISGGTYPLSRPLFVYIKDSHLKTTKGLKDFAKELVSDKAIGKEGYLVEKSLVPLKGDELKKIQAEVEGK